MNELLRLAEAAGRVHTLRNPNIEPRGAPEDTARAFDKVNPKTGARPNRSVLKKLAAENDKKFYVLEMADEGEYIMVLVMQSGVDMDQNYYGVNVLFYPDGKIDASTADKLADKQWANHKGEIIKVAKAAMKDPESPMIYDGLGGKSSKRGKGELSFAVKENMITFKQFLLAEGKFKEPGWYVCDHMDKPVRGPMQEGAAKDMAEEMSEDASQTAKLKDTLAKLQDDLKAVKGNYPGDDRNRGLIKTKIFDVKHKLKFLKGSVPAFYAEYFSETEIRRMNEAIFEARIGELSAAQKKTLLNDFKEWSGGFTPDDVDATEMSKYIRASLPTTLPKKAAVAYLKYIADNGARNAP